MQSLIYNSVNIYSQIRDELKVLIGKCSDIDNEYAGFSGSQLHYFSERCQSINLLLQEWKLWDCDILMRPALECATRFIFVSIANPKERRNRIEEYTYFLSEIEEIQRSEKAKSFVEVNDNANSVMLVGGVVLNSEREAELRAKWPKKQRHILNQKWSFSEMVKEITMFHKENVDFRSYKSFLHSYGLSSHLVHADRTALDLIWDRSRRTSPDRELLERAHFARLATEPTNLLFMCWHVMAFALGSKHENSGLVNELLELNEQADVFHKEFSQSQEHFYRAKDESGA